MVTLNIANKEPNQNPVVTPEPIPDSTKVKDESKENSNTAKLVTVEDSKAKDLLVELSDAIQQVEQLKTLNENIIKQREKEFQDYNDVIIEKLNKLYDSTNGLRVKIEHTGSYEKYIEERVKSASLNNDVAMLQSQLAVEKNEFSAFINTARTKLEDIKATDDILNKTCNDFVKNVEETYNKYIENIDNRLNEFGKDAQEKYTSLYEALKKSSLKLISEYVSNCKQNTDTIKKAAIDFLTDCQTHNTELIKKIPVVNQNKYNFKDICLYALSITGVLSLICSTILTFI